MLLFHVLLLLFFVLLDNYLFFEFLFITILNKFIISFGNKLTLDVKVNVNVIVCVINRGFKLAVYARWFPSARILGNRCLGPGQSKGKSSQLGLTYTYRATCYSTC